MYKLKNYFKFFVFVLSIFCLISCSATNTAIKKRNLSVQTKMSATVFLDPVPSDQRIVYVQVRNTSDKPDLDVESQVKEAIELKGYKVADNPDHAHYILQANVLQIGKGDLRAARYALDDGYGSTLSGAIVGAGVGSLTTNSSTGLVVGGLVGGAVAGLADALIEDTYYMAITDVQISERVGSSLSVQEKTKSKLVQGTSGSKEILAVERTQWKRYQTRIVSTANKVNLKYDQASQSLIDGLVRSISGVF